MSYDRILDLASCLPEDFDGNKENEDPCSIPTKDTELPIILPIVQRDLTLVTSDSKERPVPNPLGFLNPTDPTYARSRELALDDLSKIILIQQFSLIADCVDIMGETSCEITAEDGKFVHIKDKRVGIWFCGFFKAAPAFISEVLRPGDRFLLTVEKNSDQQTFKSCISKLNHDKWIPQNKTSTV